MGILSSLISLAFVVGAGYITITYIIPKITGKEGSNIGGQVSGTEGSADEAGAVLENLKDAVGIPSEATDEGDKPTKKPKKEKAPYDASKGMAGKGESKKKKSGSSSSKSKDEGDEKKAKKELMYIIGDGYWEY